MIKHLFMCPIVLLIDGLGHGSVLLENVCSICCPFSAPTSQWASATTEATLKFRRLPCLPVLLSIGTRTHGSDDKGTSPKFVRHSSQVIVPELKPALFFLTVVAKIVYHLLSLRSRVNLQQKSPRCFFAKTVGSLGTDVSEQSPTVCSRSLTKPDVKPPLAGTRLPFCLQRQALMPGLPPLHCVSARSMIPTVPCTNTATDHIRR